MRWIAAPFWLALFAVGLSSTEALSSEKGPVLQATVEVLEELADEGVIDALYQLADLASHPATESYFKEDAGFRYLALSAASGRASSVRWMAYRLALETDAKAEAATLLSAAALMEDRRAVIDLRLWPLLGPVNEEQVLAGFHRALERLAGGRILDCERLPFDCPPNIRETTAINAATVLYAAALRHDTSLGDFDSVVALFDRQRAAFTAFPESRYQQFLVEQRRDNRPILDRLARDAAESAADVDWETGAYRDRRRMRKEAAAQILDNMQPSSVRRYDEVIEAGLKAVNAHRSSTGNIRRETLDRGTGGRQ